MTVTTPAADPDVPPSAPVSPPPGEPIRDLSLPPEVQAKIRSWELPPEDLARFERDYKLSYHYGGLNVAVSETPDGDFVLKAAPSRVLRAWLDGLTDAQHAQVAVIELPRPWRATRRGLGLAPRRRWWLLWVA